MVLIKEFRIVMPFTVEQYRKGQRYSTAKTNNQVTKGKDGIELLKDEEYIDPKTGVKGRFTKKIYHLGGYLPKWICAILPKSALQLHEDSWDAFPHSKTVLTNPFLGERFEFKIESMHKDNDFGDTENILDLPADVLKKRTIQKLDICVDKLEDKEQRADCDTTKYHSELSGLGPLQPGWQQKVEHVMCAYKLVTVKIAVFGFQTKAESYTMNTETQIFLKFHQQIFCWLDEWFGLNLSEILEAEKKIYAEMNKRLVKDDADIKPEDEEKAKALLAEAGAAKAEKENVATETGEHEEGDEKKVHKHKHREHEHKKHKKSKKHLVVEPTEKVADDIDSSIEVSAS